MLLGVPLLLIAIGAVLTFAVQDNVSGVDLSIVGWILMAVGAVGALLTLVLWKDDREWDRREP